MLVGNPFGRWPPTPSTTASAGIEIWNDFALHCVVGGELFWGEEALEDAIAWAAGRAP